MPNNDAPHHDKYATGQGLSAEQLKADGKVLQGLLEEVGKVIVGQRQMTEALTIGLLTGGHVLVEGLPGLAKTLAVKSLARSLDAKFQRVQFTPDLLPSDLIGTLIYREQTGEFVAKKGPLFCNILLADEINRAPAKVQSALLEAMAERQVTIGETTYPMEEPFLVLATQNPIEQEGTYPLPEAQMDRFLFKLRVEYPSREEEKQILDRMTQATTPEVRAVCAPRQILEIRQRVHQVYVDDRIKEYIVRLVLSTRPHGEIQPEEVSGKLLSEIRQALRVGASPRATLFLTTAAKARALVDGRGYVVPDDVKSIAADVLRHRLLLTFEAQARGLSTDSIIQMVLQTVNVP
ncbi:MoxR family ATPase [bacterium]|nr:MoxR family ATPase [bacterium]